MGTIHRIPTIFACMVNLVMFLWCIYIKYALMAHARNPKVPARITILSYEMDMICNQNELLDET
jgi:hypothetical protein